MKGCDFMPHSYTNLLYDLVFSTKDRRPLIDEFLRSRLYEYLGGTIRGLGGVALEIGGIADHMHLLVKLRQDHAVSAILRDLKANSSGWINQHELIGTRNFAWQTGYGAFTVSESQVEKVKQYIRNQETHHQKSTFREEFVALLQAHGIEYDLEHLWR
jgi:putative transposase